MRILLIRHAQALGQEPDADLSDEGHVQARALIPLLAAHGVREVFSSPYRRAIATVVPFAASAGIAVQVVDGMRERQLATELVPDFLVHMERSFADERYRLEGGESLATTAARGLEALAHIAQTARSNTPAVASHGNLIASVLRTMDPGFGFGAWRTMRNPHVFEVELRDGTPASFCELEDIT